MAMQCVGSYQLVSVEQVPPLVAALGGLIFGFNTAIVAGVSRLLKEDFGLSDTVQALTVAILLLGGMIGAISAGPFADRFGRRPALGLSGFVCVSGCILYFAAQNLAWILAARFYLGIAVGITVVVCPLYITEQTFYAVRGRCIVLFQWFIAIGIVLAYGINVAFCGTKEPADCSDQWRFQVLLGCIPGLAMLLLVPSMPESTAWGLARTSYGVLSPEKRRTYQSVATTTRDDGSQSSGEGTSLQQPELAGSPDPTRKSADLHASRELNVRPADSTWRNLFRHRAELGVCLILAVAHQLTGINYVIYWTPLILSRIGYDAGTDGQVIIFVSIGVWNAIAVLPTFWLVDRVGRRVMLMVGLAGGIVANLVLGIAFKAWDTNLDEANTDTGFLVCTVFGFALGLASYEIGPGPLFFLLTEIFPQDLRGLGSALINFTQLGFNLAVTMLALFLDDLIQDSGTFFVFAAIGVLDFVAVYLYMPETLGLDLDVGLLRGLVT